MLTGSSHSYNGLFFGLCYLKDFLKTEDFSKLNSYFSDGDCIFKGQTLLSMSAENSLFKKQDLLSIVSYLSGAYTLISCFTERDFNFDICAGLTSNFELSDWEEQAILKAGAVVRSCPKEFLTAKQIQQHLKKENSPVLLSDLKIDSCEIKTFLKANGSVSFDLHGSFLPSDLEEFRDFNNISSVYPVCLQGSFPCLEMQFVE